MNTDNVLMHNTDVERQGGRLRDGFNRHGCFWTTNGGEQQCGLSAKRNDNSGRRREGWGGPSLS